MSVNFKEALEDIELPPLLPKHWQPKHRYIEMSRGAGGNYEEMIVKEEHVKLSIATGWRITRLSKLSQSMVNSKWVRAIIAMENIENNSLHQDKSMV